MQQSKSAQRRRCGSALGLITLTASLVTSGASASAGSLSTPTPTPGGTLIFSKTSLNATFDPAHNFISSFTDGAPMEALYGPGLVYTDTAGNLKMGFAKSLRPSSTKKVWTLVLRKGLKFSDGTPFNAQAVVANVKRLADPATGSTARTYASGISARATNATTVKFTLKAPNSQFASILAQDFSLIPSPTAVAREGASFGSHPVGAGPFKMGTLTPNVSLALVRNPNFAAYAPGQPYLDDLTIQLVGDDSQTQADLQSGQSQAALFVNGQQSQLAQKNGLTVPTNEVGGGLLLMNQSKAPFNNVLAREAVFLALNRAKVANVWAPGNPVWENYYPKTSPYYSASENWPAPNPKKAQQLFNKLASTGHPVNFTVIWPKQTNSVGAQYVASVLNTYKKVKVTVDVLLPAQFSVLQAQGNYQMSPIAVSNSSLFPSTADLLGTGGAVNYQRVSDPKIDADLAEIQAASNQRTLEHAAGNVLKESNSQFDVLPAQANFTGIGYKPSLLGGMKVMAYGVSPMWQDLYLKKS